MSALFLSVEISVLRPPPFFYIYGSQSNTEKAASPCMADTSCAQNKADDGFQCSCCKSLDCVCVCVCVVLAFSIGSRSSSIVSFGTCTLLWYRAKQEEEQTTETEAEALHISD